MIHRHKHEMTLKFPSIKNDNMLSGESHDAVAASSLSRVDPERSFARVLWVIHAQTDALVFHQENLMARLC